MALLIYWRRRLTRLEMALYAILVSVLVVVLTERLLQMYEVAERTAMETTVMTVNSAINYRLALEFASGHRPGGWEGKNAFQLVQVRPPNFLAAGTGAQSPGTWSFDEERGELVYYPRLSRGLATADPQGFVRFRLARREIDGNYWLAPTHKYEWR